MEINSYVFLIGIASFLGSLLIYKLIHKDINRQDELIKVQNNRLHQMSKDIGNYRVELQEADSSLRTTIMGMKSSKDESIDLIFKVLDSDKKDISRIQLDMKVLYKRQAYLKARMIPRKTIVEFTNKGVLPKEFDAAIKGVQKQMTEAGL